MTDQAACRTCGAPAVLVETWPPGLGRPVLAPGTHCWACLATEDRA